MKNEQKISDGYSFHKKREEEILVAIDKRLKRAEEYRSNHKSGSAMQQYYTGKCTAFEIIKKDIEKIFSS